MIISIFFFFKQKTAYDMRISDWSSDVCSSGSHYDIAVAGLKHDSMLESYVWNATATRHDMDSLAKIYLGYETVKYAEVAGKGAKQISFSQEIGREAGRERVCQYV